MEPENFVNLLLDHIETRSPLPKHHNFDLYNCQLLSEVAYKFASEKVKNYNDVLLRYIFSHNIAPNCDLMFNAKFLTQLLVKRLQNCLNPKAFTQILKDEVTWLLDEEELDILINNDSDNFTQSKPIKILIIERCNMLKRTLACEELEISRLIDGIMRMSKNKLNYPYTDEEIKLSKKLYVLQNLLEYIINYPTEYRQLANKFIEILESNDFSNFQQIFILFYLYYSDHLSEMSPLLTQLQLLKCLTIQDIQEEILENLPRLENDEMISLLFDIATLVSNSPIKYIPRIISCLGLLHRKCENDNLLKSNHKFIRDFNRIFLDIWLTLFSRIIIYENKPYINNDKQQENIYLESLFGLIFDKLFLDVPLENNNWLKILEERIKNEDDLEMEDKHREEDTVEEDEDG
ncbi:6269_t:CDS:10 [Entrophospora sp. SA101]|nr:6269_t:CDS:10 [Entrophospora sp. SA101]